MKQIYESLEQCEKDRDNNPAKIVGSLIELGEKYQSAWLKEWGSGIGQGISCSHEMGCRKQLLR